MPKLRVDSWAQTSGCNGQHGFNLEQPTQGPGQLTDTTAGFRAELRLQDRYGGVDDAHADARDNSADNELSPAVRGCL